LARACSTDIERAWRAVHGAARPRIHVFLAASDIHLQYKLRISRQQCLDQASESIRLARTFCDDVEFSPEDGTRTDPEFLCQVLQSVVDAGATTLNIPDTVGYTTPVEFGGLIRTIRRSVRGIENVVISAHCHNDLGLAVANSLAAIEAGARQVECTINGIGERAGNAALEEIVMALRVRPDTLAYDTAVATEQLYPTSQLLTEITGVGVQPNKAIIGRNAFAHEAGIHQDGMLKNPLTYEIMTPQSVGVPDSTLILGKHSGRHALGLRCQQLGFTFDRWELDDLYRRFVALADRVKKVDDHQLRELIASMKQTPQNVSSTTKAIAVPAAIGSQERKRPPQVRSLRRPSASVTIPLNAIPEPRSDQDDYFWGV
jgi:2-isopropylmalate synthase